MGPWGYLGGVLSLREVCVALDADGEDKAGGMGKQGPSPTRAEVGEAPPDTYFFTTPVSFSGTSSYLLKE